MRRLIELKAAEEALVATSKNRDDGVIDFGRPAGSPPNAIGPMMNWMNLNGQITYIDFTKGAVYTSQSLPSNLQQMVIRTVNRTHATF